MRWAEAAHQAGRPREAADALEQALTGARARGDTETQARALIQLSPVANKLGEGRQLAVAHEAVSLLEQAEPGANHVAAYSQLAGAQHLAGAYAETIAAAEQALSLAERLGLAVPARALGIRGLARACLGDADGLAEAERALALLVAQGEGRAAAVLQNNLAIARYPLQGPARSLASFEEGLAFSEQRGLAGEAVLLEGNCPGLLVELGRVEEALERAARLALQAEAGGDALTLCELRAVELATRLAQGEREPSTGRRRLADRDRPGRRRRRRERARAGNGGRRPARRRPARAGACAPRRAGTDTRRPADALLRQTTPLDGANRARRRQPSPRPHADRHARAPVSPA